MLNGPLIAKRRIALGLTRHDLARSSGVSWHTLTRLEEHHYGEATHTVSTVVRIARALGLQPADLLENTGAGGADTPDDTTLAGALLAAHPDGLDDDSIARALHWPRPKVQHAIESLATQLRPIGQALRRVNGHSQLAPATIPDALERIQTLERRAQPLSPEHARVLLRVLRGTNRERDWEQFEGADRDRLMQLVQQGALADNGRGVHTSGELRETLTAGRNRMIGDFPRASRFRRDSRPAAEPGA